MINDIQAIILMIVLGGFIVAGIHFLYGGGWALVALLITVIVLVCLTMYVIGE